jgi:hypothetical protein
LVRDARPCRAPHHEGLASFGDLILRSGVFAASRRMRPLDRKESGRDRLVWNAIASASEAIHSSGEEESWIASSQSLLAKTLRKCLDFRTPAETFAQVLHFECESTSPRSRGRRKERHTSAIPRRVCARVMEDKSARTREGVGNAGCSVHPQPRMQKIESIRA